MTVGEAKAIAREWVLEHASQVPGLQGVFTAGSTNWRSDDSEHSHLSDVDLFHVVTGDPAQAMRQEKHIYRGVLLETEAVGHESFVNAEAALGAWRFAAHFSVPSVVYDPSGHLSEVQKSVATHYAEREWVRRRCNALVSEARQGAAGMRGPGAFDDRLGAFFFAANLVGQLPLIASLRPPTVRKSFMLFSDAMRAIGHPEIANDMFDYLGSSRITGQEAERLLEAATAVYDRALEVHNEPSAHDYDLCPAARPVMIGGCRDMIDRGYHREAAMWILATHWIPTMCLRLEVPEEYDRTWRAPFQRLLDILGIGSAEAIAGRHDAALDLLARTMAVAEEIIREGGR
jgi:hypothetical protein